MNRGMMAIVLVAGCAATDGAALPDATSEPTCDATGPLGCWQRVAREAADAPFLGGPRALAVARDHLYLAGWPGCALAVAALEGEAAPDTRCLIKGEEHTLLTVSGATLVRWTRPQSGATGWSAEVGRPDENGDVALSTVADSQTALYGAAPLAGSPRGCVLLYPTGWSERVDFALIESVTVACVVEQGALRKATLPLPTPVREMLAPFNPGGLGGWGVSAAVNEGRVVLGVYVAYTDMGGGGSWVGVADWDEIDLVAGSWTPIAPFGGYDPNRLPLLALRGRLLFHEGWAFDLAPDRTLGPPQALTPLPFAPSVAILAGDRVFAAGERLPRNDALAEVLSAPVLAPRPR